MIVRLRNGPLARMLHFALYDRMKEFCNRVNPEIPGEGMVKGWLDRLFADDLRLHILVNLDDHYSIIEHAVIDVQTVGDKNVVVCHQAFRDKPNLETFKYGLQYIDELRKDTRSVCSAIYMQKHMRALEKEGYKAIQVLMIKCSNDSEDQEEDTHISQVLQEVQNGVSLS